MTKMEAGQKSLVYHVYSLDGLQLFGLMCLYILSATLFLSMNSTMAPSQIPVQLPEFALQNHIQGVTKKEENQCADMHCEEDKNCPIIFNISSITIGNVLHPLRNCRKALFLTVLPHSCSVQEIYEFDMVMDSASAIKEDRIEEVRTLIEQTPENTVLLGEICAKHLPILYPAFPKLDGRRFLSSIERKERDNLQRGYRPLKFVMMWESGHFGYQHYKLLNTIYPRDWKTTFHKRRAVEIQTKYLSFQELEKKYPTLRSNVGWSPSLCKARHRIAVIVPYRNREEHLHLFLNHMIAFLQSQMLSFKIYIVEQIGAQLFNRATLLNIGHVESRKDEAFDCYVFTDVDHLPEDLCNLYMCGKHPRHLSVALDKNYYKLPYRTYVGGGMILNETHLKTINGFSNIFFGWGGEDDNAYRRLVDSGFRIQRYPTYVARYTTLHHDQWQNNPDAGTRLHTSWKLAKYKKYDGTSSLNYTLIERQNLKLYTHIKAGISGPTEIRQVKSYVSGMEKMFLSQIQGEYESSKNLEI